MTKLIKDTQVEDFLNPKSMPTPAAAGAIVALIAGVLFKNFGVSVAFCSLTLSFMVGVMVFQSNEFKSDPSSKPIKLILYIINSLIIFSMATGTTSVMANDVITQQRALFNDWTKNENKYPIEELYMGNNNYEVHSKVVNHNTGSIKSWLQEKGIMTKNYETKISIIPKVSSPGIKLEEVKISFPKGNFNVKKVKINPDQSEFGITVNAWKNFLIEVEVTNKQGGKIKFIEYINPEKLTENPE